MGSSCAIALNLLICLPLLCRMPGTGAGTALATSSSEDIALSAGNGQGDGDGLVKKVRKRKRRPDDLSDRFVACLSSLRLRDYGTLVEAADRPDTGAVAPEGAMFARPPPIFGHVQVASV